MVPQKFVGFKEHKYSDLVKLPPTSGTSEICGIQRTQVFRPGKAASHKWLQPCQYKTNVSYGRSSQGVLICSAALNARCAAEQTQTIQRQSTTTIITNAPIQGKEKSPQLDDGGTGFPPRDDDGGGGGGGGGGPYWSGGFFFFGLLALLGLLKDQESEGPYRDSNRR
ncbi:hypothetical protein HPP92_020049 [Vanilla planifolia]|uniref:Uncharacterized protein n=1 Tax=Vanilla planifolia TaxID=51239 RepID=A0A835Q7X4_VANPL|nr:hypothetical protein HPP92_020049 [Vanilla planifolia]